jgi:hypothetical protein
MPATDFDFLFGSWSVHNRYLVGRLRGSTEWIEFEATIDAWPLLGGMANVDSYTAVREGRTIHGTTLRLFDPHTDRWSLHWADTVRPGSLLPPMVGRFEGGLGEFFGDEEVDGRRVLCRFRWTGGKAPRWEQAFSDDEGKTWEVNWVMTLTESSPQLHRAVVTPTAADLV